MARGAARDTELLVSHFGVDAPLKVHVISLSDRAAEGEYEDRSGPRLRQHAEEFFSARGIPAVFESKLLSDDADRLREELVTLKKRGAHVVFTTGGTGVGPRDHTTDVVLELADKTIPGIMEAVRMKYGLDKPCALLSRTVAAVIGSVVVYALPGSTKGVDEYMTEVLKSIEHLICVVQGLDVH